MYITIRIYNMHANIRYIIHNAIKWQYFVHNYPTEKNIQKDLPPLSDTYIFWDDKQVIYIIWPYLQNSTKVSKQVAP